MFWAIIGRRLAGKDFHTEKELEDEVKRIWDEVAQGPIVGLVESFRSRLELCLACNGAPISQLLSSDRMGPRPQDIADVDGFPAFTAEVDAAIREWVGWPTATSGRSFARTCKRRASCRPTSRRSYSRTVGISPSSKTAARSSLATV
jgi:hypothetical protein